MKANSLLLLLLLAAGGLSGCATYDDPHAHSDKRSVEEMRADWDYNRRLAAKEEADFRLFLQDYAERLGKPTVELTAAQRSRAHAAFIRDNGSKYPYRRVYRYAYDHGTYYDRARYSQRAQFVNVTSEPLPKYPNYRYHDDAWW